MEKVADCKVVSSGNQLGNLMVLSGWSLVNGSIGIKD